jgi:UDP-arabinose 4-epimerase
MSTVKPPMKWKRICTAFWSLVFVVVVANHSQVQTIPAVTPKLRNDREIVLLTGVAGFIGSHTALQLMESGHTVIGLDNMSRGSEKALKVLSSTFPQYFVFELVDLGDANAVDRVFRKYKISVVIHLAAVAFVGESVKFPSLYYQNITTNTELLVDKMLLHSVKRIVFASSSAVYGMPSEQPASEEMTAFPLSPYGQAKLEAEKYIQSKILRGFILRYFNVIGADSKGRLGENPRPEDISYARLWSSCLAAIEGRIPCLQVLQGTSTRDFVHVEDVARANVRAMVASSPEFPSEIEILNVASKAETTLDFFVHLAKQVSNAKILMCNHSQDNSNLRQGNEPSRLYGSHDKIKERIGWTPLFINVSEMLSTSWNYSLAQSCNEEKQKFQAVLISGQCQRFIYRDQLGPLFELYLNPLCAPKIDVYVALHCGESAKPWTGVVDSPSYINDTNLNVSDIQYWFQSVRGANTVQVKIFDDVAMEAVDQEVFSFATNVRGSDVTALREFVNASSKIRWKPHSRMFFLRHAAFRMSISDQQSYHAYTYWREDNYFFSPLDMAGDFFGNHTSQPYVVVDELCEFGSYSDKMYIMNRAGAELLFDSTRSDFLKKMKNWVQFAKVQNDQGDPFQTERFLHDILSLAVVQKRVLMRVDARYMNGTLCIPGLYYHCLTSDLKAKAGLVGLHQC